MFSVYKREFKSLFCGYRAYVFTAIFAVCYVAIRMIYNYMLLYENIYGFINHEYVLTLLPAVFALAVPVITFSMYEDERKKDTFSFLRSLPLTGKDVFFGKYLARVTLFLIVYAVFMCVDFFLGSYSGSTLMTVAFSVLSYILICNCVLTIDIFIASVCKNKFVSLGISYGITAALTALTLTRGMMPRIVSEIVAPISLFSTYTASVFGMIDISSLILWLSLGGLFVFLSYTFFKKEIRL